MSDTSLRLIIFLTVFAAMGLLELAAPRRVGGLGRSARWPGAFVLLFTGIVLARLVVPVGVAGAAVWAQAQGFGLFNHVDAPEWLIFGICFLALDLGVWAQHVVMHRVDTLWRLHRVHHSDPGFDVTTALRFHPVEILLSLFWKAALVITLGAPAMLVFLFEVALNGFAQFNHANIKLPDWLDRIVRLVVVTPDMHRVHHSTDSVEHNRNFGFCLSIWDRVFRLYKGQPDLGQTGMKIGLDGGRATADQRADRLLFQPLRSALD